MIIAKMGLAGVLGVIMTCATAAWAEQVVKDPSLEKDSDKFLSTVDYTGDGEVGIAEFVEGVARTGDQAVLLEAYSYDYSRVFRDIDGNRRFSDINEVSFWFKHDGNESLYSDLTPYSVIRILLDVGPYAGGTLIVVGNSGTEGGYATDWTRLANDRWHYQLYDYYGDLVEHTGDLARVPLSELQYTFDGELDAVGVGVGLSGGAVWVRAFVDDIEVTVDETALRNIVKDFDFEKPKSKYLDAVDYTGDGEAGIAKFVHRDSYSGHYSVLLEAFSWDYSSVELDTDKRKFEEVGSVNFRFKHDGDPMIYGDGLPYAVLQVEIKEGQYKGGTLIAVGIPTGSGRALDWELMEHDRFHYQVFDKRGNLVDSGGLPGGMPLADLQSMFVGKIESAAIGLGLSGGPVLSRVLVDDLVVLAED